MKSLLNILLISTLCLCIQNFSSAQAVKKKSKEAVKGQPNAKKINSNPQLIEAFELTKEEIAARNLRKSKINAKKKNETNSDGNAGLRTSSDQQTKLKTSKVMLKSSSDQSIRTKEYSSNEEKKQ